MIKGGDVSHWNTPSDVISRIKADNLRFLFIKASEGRSYKDPKAAYYNTVCEQMNVMPGFYHYARPEAVQNAEQEAVHFVKTVESITGEISRNNDGMLLALDWEGEALKHDFNYALEWCKHVLMLAGIAPVIYTGYSYINTDLKGKYQPISEYGLWCARWNNTPLKGLDSIEPWEVVAFHQYTSSNGKFDYDVFNGTEERLKLYGESIKSGEIETPTKPCQCGCCDN